MHNECRKKYDKMKPCIRLTIQSAPAIRNSVTIKKVQQACSRHGRLVFLYVRTAMDKSITHLFFSYDRKMVLNI